MAAPVATVLYVEDDADDVFFLRRALRRQNVECTLQTVSTVAAAKAYLGGNVPYDDRVQFPMPDLVVTDMTIPGVEESSLDLVFWIRSTAALTKLPIICATGNDQPRMLQQFERLGIICHPKSSHMTEIADGIKTALRSDA